MNNFFQSKRFVVLLGALTAFDPLTIDMYLPAFGEIQRDLHTTISNVELSVSTFFVGMALGQLIYGPLADRFGRRKPLLAGMMIYLLATIGCALSTQIESFIAFRLLQAFGGCAGMVITRAIIRDVFEKRQVAVFLSNMALVMGLAPILAPSIGSFINSLFGWKAIFYALAIGNVICMTAIAKFLPETIQQRKTTQSVRSIASAYYGLIRDRHFVGYLIPDMALRAAMFAYIAGSPFVFIELLGLKPSHYALVFGFNGFGLMLAAQINRRLLVRWSSEKILNWAVRSAAVLSLFVLLSGQMGQAVPLMVSLFLFLATLNFVSPNSLAGALASQGHQAGTASALYGSFQWGMATFTSFLVSYFHNQTALPMTGVIFFCGCVSLTCYQLLVRRASPVIVN